MIKKSCQICGKKKDVVELMPYRIWNYLCQSFFDKQNYLNKNKGVKNGNTD